MRDNCCKKCDDINQYDMIYLLLVMLHLCQANQIISRNRIDESNRIHPLLNDVIYTRNKKINQKLEKDMKHDQNMNMFKSRLADESKAVVMNQMKEDLYYSSKREDRFPYAVCILTSNIGFIQVKWLRELFNYNISAYIMIDDPDRNEVTKSSVGYTQIISINSMDSKRIGYYWGGKAELSIDKYQSSNIGIENPSAYYHKHINAWDKSLLYFTEIAMHHSFVWFIEYDVYIPSISSFLKVHNDSVSQKADLVIRESTELSYARAHKFNHFLKAPLYNSLACVVGASRKLLDIIKQYVAQHQQLEYVEILFTTLSQQHKLKVYHPVQFQAIQFRCNFTCSDVHRYPDQWFHPIKDQWQFIDDCRNRVSNLSLSFSTPSLFNDSLVNSSISNYSYRDADSYNRYLNGNNSDKHTIIRFENEANCTLSK